MIKRTLVGLFILASASLSHAVTWNPLQASGASYTVPYKGTLIQVTIDPPPTDTDGGGPLTGGWVADVPKQGEGFMAGYIQQLDPAAAFLDKCDSDCAKPSAGAFRLDTDSPFHWLAVHYGNGDYGDGTLLFYFATATKYAVISGLSGFSNMQAFSGSGVSPVPLPGAALLFLSALGIGAATRKRKLAAA